MLKEFVVGKSVGADMTWLNMDGAPAPVAIFDDGDSAMLGRLPAL